MFYKGRRPPEGRTLVFRLVYDDAIGIALGGLALVVILEAPCVNEVLYLCHLLRGVNGDSDLGAVIHGKDADIVKVLDGLAYGQHNFSGCCEESHSPFLTIECKHQQVESRVYYHLLTGGPPPLGGLVTRPGGWPWLGQQDGTGTPASPARSQRRSCHGQCALPGLRLRARARAFVFWNHGPEDP